MAKLKQYLWNILVAIDRLANSALGGDPEMTLSGRMGRAIANGNCKLCKPVCWMLDKVDPNHCAKQAAKETHEGSDQVTGV